MTLGQPIIRVGHGGTASRAAIALNSKGNVTVGYDVGKGAATVLAGDFEFSDSEFRLLDTGAEIDLSGVLVRDPLLVLLPEFCSSCLECLGVVRRPPITQCPVRVNLAGLIVNGMRKLVANGKVPFCASRTFGGIMNSDKLHHRPSSDAMNMQSQYMLSSQASSPSVRSHAH
jgi:hypothetical protein